MAGARIENVGSTDGKKYGRNEESNSKSNEFLDVLLGSVSWNKVKE